MTELLCAFCDAPLPDNGRGPARARVICDADACRRRASAFGARKLVALMARRRAAEPPKTEHTCVPCGRTFPLTDEHFYVDKRDPETGEVVRYSGWCKDCKRDYQRGKTAAAGDPKAQARNKQRAANRRRRLREDPAYAERRRRQQRENARRWRARNPEKARAAQRRYRARLKRDPKRLAAKRESDRMKYRLNRERAGLPINVRTRHEGEREEVLRALPALPSRELARAIDRLVTRERGPNPSPNDATEKAVCARLDVDPRRLYGWRVGEYERVQWNVADRVCTRAGWLMADVWAPEVLDALFADRDARAA